MGRGAAVVAAHARVGEAAARARLGAFLAGAVADYPAARDFPGREGTSGLSENLAWGEIGVRELWHRAAALRERGGAAAAGAEAFLREIGWREFAWHLLRHTPHIATRNWRQGWDAFPWQGDGPQARAWRRGMTGEPFVDAAMRALWVTGTLHNRARMVAASYLTKHLLTDWRVGMRWFENCLIDWDPASNAMGWQWVAGSGPDAAPFFRIFNPAAQAARFDPDGAWQRRWLPGPADPPAPEALAFFAAAPRAWGLDPRAPCPPPLMGHAEGRARALAAHARARP